MSEQQHRETPVWDLPTRLFHWALVLLVGTNLFLVEPEGGIATVIHMTAGYIVIGLLLFRLVWGFVGSPRSRFADFMHPWTEVKSYAARLRRLAPPRSIGHNPLGGWMILVMLAALVGLVITGVFASGRNAAGALATSVPVDLTAVLGEAHEFFGNVMIALVIVHVAGVVVDWLLTRENIVKAMVTGRKRLPADLSARERPLVGGARAGLIGVFCLAVVGGLVAATDYSLNRAALQQGVAAPEMSSED
jgi:cytochrome b